MARKTVADLDQDVEKLTVQVGTLERLLQPFITLMAAGQTAGEQAADAVDATKTNGQKPAPAGRLKVADESDDEDQDDGPEVVVDECPECREEIAYTAGVERVKCPGCGTRLDVSDPDDDDDEAEDDDKKPRRNPDFSFSKFFGVGRR